MVKHISNTIFIISLLLAGLAVFNSFLGNKGAKVYIVTSGSMQPAIKTGSLVIAIPQNNYLENDVITFSSGPKTTTTHRIMHKSYPAGIESDPLYQTAGDANKSFDTNHLLQKDIVGRVILSIPFVGLIMNLAKSPQGFILMVIVPATIIIYEELKSLVTVSKQAFQKFSPKPLAIIPIVGALFILVSLTGAYLSDREISINNVIQTAISTPSPTP